MYKVVCLFSNITCIYHASVTVFRKAVIVQCCKLVAKDFSQDSGMTDISCMGCMFQDIQIESTGFLLVVFCLTSVKLLPPALTSLDVNQVLCKYCMHASKDSFETL